MNSTLYLTRNGLLEPLGQSQVFAYLRGLSRYHRITLVTFEKPEDWFDRARVASARAECERHGIRWLPQKFRSRPRGVASGVAMLRMAWLVWREARQGRAELVHARSYIPAAVALVVHRLTGVPFIFDMRALWPEELITAGRLQRGSLLHRMIAAAERACLRHAAAVVSLTEAAVEHLRSVYPNELDGQRIVVIPTCADLDRFVPCEKVEERAGEEPIYGCIGTVLSGWFRLDWLAAFFAAVARRDAEARFEIVTRDDPDEVRAVIGGGAVVQDRLSIYTMRPERVHEAVQRQTVSAMFYAGGEVSELGRSPTRMAEILGCGLLVVANAGVGDVARIIEGYRVGVLVESASADSMDRSLDALAELRTDPELPSRCRQAAEEMFSLERGTEAYRALYNEVLAKGGGSGATPLHSSRNSDGGGPRPAVLNE